MDTLDRYGEAGLILSAVFVAILLVPTALDAVRGGWTLARKQVAVGDFVTGPGVSGRVVGFRLSTILVEEDGWLHPFKIPWGSFRREFRIVEAPCQPELNGHSRSA